jgi:hypothetical protein
MPRIDQVAADLARAQAQLARSLTDAGAWQDDQRARLDRSRIDPLEHAVSNFGAAMRQASEAIATAERLLSK